MEDKPLRFTRHARRRMRLYGIGREHVEATLAAPQSTTTNEANGRLEATRRFPGAFKDMPLKVVYVIEERQIVVLSAYPLKRTYRRGHEG